MGVGGEDFTVARVKRQIFEESTIGAIYTRHAGGADNQGTRPSDSHTAGIDLDFRTSRFLGDKNLQVDGFFVWNSNSEPSVDRTVSDLSARGLRIDFPNDIWQGHLSYREFGGFYDPAVGFVTRNGFRRVEPNVTWRPRPEISWIRQFEFRHSVQIPGVHRDRASPRSDSGGSTSSVSISRTAPSSPFASLGRSSTSTVRSRSAARRRTVTIGLSTEVLLKTGGHRRRAGQTTPPAEALREERQFAWASAAFSHLTPSLRNPRRGIARPCHEATHAACPWVPGAGHPFSLSTVDGRPRRGSATRVGASVIAPVPARWRAGVRASRCTSASSGSAYAPGPPPRRPNPRPGPNPPKPSRRPVSASSRSRPRSNTPA